MNLFIVKYNHPSSSPHVSCPLKTLTIMVDCFFFFVVILNMMALSDCIEMFVFKLVKM